MRIQKAVKMHGVGRGNNPNSRKALDPKNWYLLTEDQKNKKREKISSWSKQFYADETKHPKWKGNDVGYRSLHKWVSKWLGVPCACTACQKTGTGHSMHWANISGQYKRTLDDWVRLCPKCHKSFDKKYI